MVYVGSRETEAETRLQIYQNCLGRVSSKVQVLRVKEKRERPLSVPSEAETGS